MSENVPKKKRNDIQGLRAIAIVGVLMFHLSPKQFNNGFLGVDIFFVLSGYLMSSILSRETSLNGKVIQMFLIRRFKRIVPLYSIMLAVLMVVTPYIFLPSDMPHFISEMKWALPFVENMRNVLESHDYWSEVFNSPVLLHAWSLGVEIQYYIIVPFIMILVRFAEARGFKMILFAVIIGGSFAFHCWSSNEVSFGLLFARVWQFLIGSISFELESGLDIIELGKPGESRWLELMRSLHTFFSCWISVSLLVIVMFPTTGFPMSRMLVTVASGLLLILGKYTQTWITSNKMMSFVGDLSYLIYLVHWPVIVLYKYYNDVQDLSATDMLNCLFVTVFFSVLFHHSIERYFITAPTIFCSILVALLYSIIIFAVSFGNLQRFSEYAHPLIGSDPASVRRLEAIRWNQAESNTMYFQNPVGCGRDFEAERWTGFLLEEQLRCISNGTGTAKVLLIGNSFAYRAFPLLHRLFAGRYSQMRMFTKSGRVFLTEDGSDLTHFAELEKNVIERFKPDITFLIEMDSLGTLSKPIVGSSDPVTLQVQTAATFLSEHSGQVVIDQQYVKPPFKDGIAYRIQKRLQMGLKRFDDLRISKKEYENEFANEIARMATIKHDNVIVNNVQDQLCPGEDCYFYNRENMHAYYGDTGAHLTSEGLELLRPGYNKIIEEFLSRFKEGL